MTMRDQDDPDVDPDHDDHVPASRSEVSWVPTTLVVVATVLAIVAGLTTWVRTQALDTDEWVSASSELLAQPDVQDALATYLTGELFTQVDVEGELAEALPGPLAGLAGPLGAALREPATAAVEELVASPRFAQAWARANRAAHTAAVAVLEGDSTAVASTADGAITLDLGELVVETGEDLGVSSATLARIPPGTGQIVLFQSDQLAQAQQAVRVLKALSWFLFLVVVGLYALAVVLSRGQRRKALQHVGTGLVVAGVTLVVARAIGVRTAVDLAVDNVQNQAAAGAAGRVGTQLLGQTGWALVLYGLLFLAFALLLGESRWAVRIRGSAARWSDSTEAVVAVTVVAIGLLWWWSPGQAFDHWVTGLVLVGLAIGAVVMFMSAVRNESSAHRTLAEVPAPGVGAGEGSAARYDDG